MNGAGGPGASGFGSVYAVQYSADVGADAKFFIQPQSAATQIAQPGAGLISGVYASLYYPNYPNPDSHTPILTDDLVTTIQNSGFTTINLGLFHISAATDTHQLGDLIFNQGPAVVSNGTVQTSMVGSDSGSDWAHYLTALKSAGAVNKIYLSFGTGFQVIIDEYLSYLDPTTSSGPYIPCDSVLYENFQALRTYLPMADGVDIDQESGTGQDHIDAMTAFGIMARSVGFGEITYVPPFDSFRDAYQAAAQNINAFALNSDSLTIGGTSYSYSGLAYPTSGAPASLPGFSTRMGLQYYSGGFAGPDPDTHTEGDVSNWQAAMEAIGASGGGNAPLLLIGASGWYNPSPNSIAGFLLQYPSSAWTGGFIWDFNAVAADLSGYQQAIQTGVAFS